MLTQPAHLFLALSFWWSPPIACLLLFLCTCYFGYFMFFVVFVCFLYLISVLGLYSFDFCSNIGSLDYSYNYIVTPLLSPQLHVF